MATDIGHPEPVTLSRTLEAKSISNVVYLTKYVTNKLREYIKKINDNTLTKEEVAEIILDWVAERLAGREEGSVFV